MSAPSRPTLPSSLRALRSLAVVALAAAASLTLVACSSDEDGEASPIVPTATITLTASPTPSSTAAPSAPPSQDARRSGVAELDSILEAVESRDVLALGALAEVQEIGCTTAEGLGGPPKCEDGMPEGSVLRVFPTASCEGAWTNTPTQALGTFAYDAAGAWGVLQVQGEVVTDGWPSPEYLIVFHSTTVGEDWASYLEVADGRITRLVQGCGGTLDDLLAISAFRVELMAGPWDEPAPEAAPAPSTGIEAVDGILAAVATYDVAPLAESAQRAMQDLPPVACEEPPLMGPSGVECNAAKGETPGTAVSVFPIAYCEGALERDPLPPLRFFLDQVPELYAVVEAPSEPSQSELYQHGAYWLVYELRGAPSDVQAGVRLHVTAEGNVTAVWFGCQPRVEQMVLWDGEPLPAIEVREE
ncbi:MAG: hypothetical protein AB7F65_12315 [Dehalococcoidia bacterium]